MRNIGEYRFARVLMDTSSILLDVYGDAIHQSPEMALALRKLQGCVRDEEELTCRMLSLQGAIEMFVASVSSAGRTRDLSGMTDSMPLLQEASDLGVTSQFTVTNLHGGRHSHSLLFELSCFSRIFEVQW